MADENNIEVVITARNETATGTEAAAAQINAASAQMTQPMSALRNAQQSAATGATALGAAAGKAAQGLNNAAAAGRAAGAGMHVGATGMREFVVLAHELATGRFSRIPGSIMVLTSRMNGLGAVLNFIKSPFGLAATAAVGFGAALALLAYEAFKTEEAINNLAGAAEAQGLGGTAAADVNALRHQLEGMRRQFALSNTEMRDVATTFTRLPASVRQYASALENAAVLQSQVTHGDLKKTLEEWDRAAQGGAAGLLKFGVANNLVSEQQQHNIEVMIKGGHQAEALSEIVHILTSRVNEYGGSVAEARDKTLDWWSAISEVAMGIGTYGLGRVATRLMPVTGSLAPAVTGVAPTTPPETPEHREHFEAVDKANAALTHREEIEQQLKAVEAAMKDAQDDLNAAISQGNKELTEAAEREEQRAAAAKKNLQIQLQGVHTAFETRVFEQQKAALDEELKAAQGNAQEQARIYQQLAELEAQYYGQGSEQAIEAQNRVTDAVRKNAAEQLQIFAQTIRAQADLSNRGSQARVSAEQQILSRMQQLQKSGPAGAVTPQQITEEKIRLANVERQAQQEAYRNFAEDEQLKVASAKDNTQQIIAIYQDWLAKASGTYHQDARTLESIQRQMVSAVQSAYAQMYSAAMQSVSASAQVGRLQQSAYERTLKAEVDQHKITTEQEFQLELQHYSQYIALQKGMLQAVLETGNLTVQEKQSVQIKLMELDEQYAEKAAQVNSQIAADAKKDLEKQEAAYKTFFNSVGSAMEQFLAAGVERSERYRQAMKKLLDSITGSAIHAIGSALSQAAAGPLAKLLGTHAEAGQGIGDVLGSAITEKVMGLFGAKKQESAADKQVTAIQANTEALKSMPAALQQAFTSAIGSLHTQLITSGPGSGAAGRGGISFSESSGGSPQPVTLAADTNLPPQARAFLDTLAGPESGGAYNVRYTPRGPAVFEDLSRQPNILEPGPEGPSSASGRYQLTHSTGQALSEQLGITDFSPVSQDRLAWQNAVEAYKRQTGGGDLLSTLQSGNPGDINRAFSAMRSSNQWTTANPSRYQANLAAEVARGTQQGTQEGMTASQPAITTAVGQGTTSGNQGLTTADQTLTTSLTDNTRATSQNTSATQAGGGVPGGAGASAGGGGGPGVLGAATGLMGTVGRFVPAVGQIGGIISGVQQAAHQIQQLGSAAVPAVSNLTHMGSVAQTAATATQLGATAQTAHSAAVTAGTGAEVTKTAATTTGTTIYAANTAATTANTVATTANSASMGGGGAIGLLGAAFFKSGGIVPSAAGGMLTGSGGGARLAILHPREMVLPSRISEGVQRAVDTGSFGGGINANKTNSDNANFTYAPTIQGAAPFMTRGGVEAMLRAHGTEMFRYARNMARNGTFRYS